MPKAGFRQNLDAKFQNSKLKCLVHLCCFPKLGACVYDLMVFAGA